MREAVLERERHGNLAIFVPHAGCPGQCSYCNQHEISGEVTPPTPEQVALFCRDGLAHARGKEVEIAFFGGSFTAINRSYMVSLLKAASTFVDKKGGYSGIRISTRPDAIDNDVLRVLKSYGVTAIEMGAQSMDDRVLEQNRRGHSAAQVARAAGLIRADGFEMGLQMMTGLYGADEESDLLTAQRLASLSPDTVRIYPTIVLERTYLEELYRSGVYQPQTLAQAVALGARLLDFFLGTHIKVIRMGLHAQETLDSNRIAGPYHPAFRELCEGELLTERLKRAFAGKPAGGYVVWIAKDSVSKLTGHGAVGVARLKKMGYTITIKQSDSLSGLQFQIEDV